MPKLIRTRRDTTDDMINSAPKADPELERYRALIKLDRHALDSAAEEQAQLFLDICDHHTRALSLRDEAKESLARTDAEVASGIRRQAKAKLTEGAIYDQVVQSLQHIKATTEYERKRRDTDFWGNLRSAFDQRAKMIRELTGQYSAGYFTVQSSVQARRSGAQTGRDALHTARISSKD